ncbi:MAG: hypothetical protein M1476_04575 [Candidatus Thermoplasmatota archaeon]|nr:hypothetical protein [Candidatus Thermoplasmatota archaeon]
MTRAKISLKRERAEVFIAPIILSVIIISYIAVALEFHMVSIFLDLFIMLGISICTWDLVIWQLTGQHMLRNLMPTRKQRM